MYNTKEKTTAQIVTDLEAFLTKSRDWVKVIPFLHALRDNCNPEEFDSWIRYGSTLKLIDLKAQLSDEVMTDLYKDRGKITTMVLSGKFEVIRDDNDPCPENNDYMSLDTAHCYMVDRHLEHVDDPKKYEK